MNFKGVIFDLDGVLCFTDRYALSREGTCRPAWALF